MSPATTPKTTVSGSIDRVPCPWCGKPNDYRIMQSEQLLDTGNQHFCDHCGYSMEIVSMRTVELVTVRKDPSGKRQPQHPGHQPRPQVAPKQGILQRLLGAPKGRG